MKEFNLLIWLSQLGLSTALPLAGFVLLGVWLHNHLGWGQWCIWAGLVLGVISAVNGFRDSLKAMERMSKKHDNPEPLPVSFNQHE